MNVSWLKQTDDYQLVPVSISPQILVARWESALMDEVANGRQKLTNSVATSTIILDRRIWQQLGLYPPATLQGDVRSLVGKYQLIYTVLQYCTAGICDICAMPLFSVCQSVHNAWWRLTITVLPLIEVVFKKPKYCWKLWLYLGGNQDKPRDHFKPHDNLVRVANLTDCRICRWPRSENSLCKIINSLTRSFTPVYINCRSLQ